MLSLSKGTDKRVYRTFEVSYVEKAVLVRVTLAREHELSNLLSDQSLTSIRNVLSIKSEHRNRKHFVSLRGKNLYYPKEYSLRHRHLPFISRIRKISSNKQVKSQYSTILEPY